MAIRFENGRPYRGEREVIIVAAAFEPLASERQTRNRIRSVVEAGYGGIVLPDLDSDAAARADEAARHAGLAVVLQRLPEPTKPHQIPVDGGPLVQAVSTPAAAYQGMLAGARVIHGPSEAVSGLLGWLELIDDPLAWTARPERNGWLVSGGAGELGALTDGQGALSLSAAECAGRWLHWVEPATGQVLGVVTPEPDKGLELTGPGELTAVYLGPNRYRPDTTTAMP